MSLPIGRLFQSLVGAPNPSSHRHRSKRSNRTLASRGDVLLGNEPLEARAMLAVTISLSGGTSGDIIVTQDSTPAVPDQVEVVLSKGTVTFGLLSETVDGITVNAVTAAGSPFASGTFFPFLDPFTNATVDNVQILLNGSNTGSTAVKVSDKLSAVNIVNGLPAAWEVTYTQPTAGFKKITVENVLSKLTVDSSSTVTLDGNFGAGQVTLQTGGVKVGSAGGGTVSAGDFVLNTAAAGTGAITFVDNLTATGLLQIKTNAALVASANITANDLQLTLGAGGSQTGGSLGTIGASPKLALTAGGAVTFNSIANTLGEIQNLKAAGQAVSLGSATSITQAAGAALEAQSLLVRSLNAITLANATNDVDTLGVIAGGTVTFVDTDELVLGAGGTGVAAIGSSVAITTSGNLTQSATGQVVAGTFTATLNVPLTGNANLNLNSANNQIGQFSATNASAGGGVTIVNTPVAAPLVIAGVTTLNGPISITNGTGIDITGAVNAGSLGAVTLSSVGDISQSAAITALSLSVVNNKASGAIDLSGVSNNVANLAIQNNSNSAVSNGIKFKGGSPLPGGSGLLTIGVGGAGLSAAVGNIAIDTNGLPLVIGASISTAGGGDVTLKATGGVTQAGGAGIAADELTVINATSGAVVLDSAKNDVGSLAVTNAGAVTYTDANDLALKTGGGIVAADSITLSVGGTFTSTTGNVLSVTGATGAISLTSVGTATLGGAVTAKSGVDIAAGTGTKTSDIAINAAVDGGAGAAIFTATGSVTTNAAGSILSGTDVSITGPTSVTLGANVTATAGALTVTSSGGGVTTLPGAALAAAAGAVSVQSKGAASFGGPVTAGTTIDVLAGDDSTASSITVDGAFVAGGDIVLAAFSAITTSAAITGGSVAMASAGSTTLGAAVTANLGAIDIAAGGSFTSKVSAADLTAAGDVNVTSVGAMSLSGGATGANVTLTAGTASSAANISLKDAITANFGSTTITATGGTLTSTTGAPVTATGGDAVLVAPLGITLGAAVSGVDVSATAATGAIKVAAVAATSEATLVAANGITQTGGITAAALLATNTAAGGIVLTNGGNAVSVFEASNAASGQVIKLVNAASLTVGSLGVTSLNGEILINNDNGGAGGALALGGVVNAGTADVTLRAAGDLTQSNTAAITGANLELSSNGGDILLESPSNDVNFLFGNTNGGKFFFRDADALEIAAPITRPITTNGGDVSITSGGVLTIGGTVNSGAGDITLQATGGITGLSVHAIQSGGTVTLANSGSGNIVSTNPGNSFPRLSAVSPSGTTIDVKSAQAVEIVGSGLQVSGGTIQLQAAGAITQSKDIQSRDATFISTGAVTLNLPTNDVDNLAIKAAGAIDFSDTDDLAIGTGGNGIRTNFANVTLTAGKAMTINNEVFAGRTGFTGAVTLSLAAGAGIRQTASQVTADDLLITNTTTDLVQLAQSLNEFDRLAMATLGNARIVEQTGFETGVTRGAVPLPVEVSAFDLDLSTAGPFSRLRVVSGLSYAITISNVPGLTALSLKAGDATVGVGLVEFVPTNGQDNLTPFFEGTMRDMIRYANDNRATQTINGATRTQPQTVVFDQPGYAVNDNVLAAALPAITRPLNFDGTRSNAGRVGIDGSAIASTATINGLVYNAGSNNSTVNGMAVYGFATGAGIQLRSAVNTVTNTYLGLERDGLTVSSNKIGVEITGQTATSNTIGTVVVDELAANVIGGNSYAGVVVRNGATANAIVGNFIGTDSTLAPNLGNSEFGVVLDAVNGNFVGSRNAVRPDGTAAASNVIANNNLTGVVIVNAKAATSKLGNLIENNLIDANAIHGIEVVNSTFQTIGGIQARQANVVTNQAVGAGIAVVASADITLAANYIGVDAVGSTGLGNALAGVLVDSSVRTVINAGNRIGSNGRGVWLAKGSTGNRVEGNFIGTNEAGDILGNAYDGVLIDRSIGNFVRLGNIINNNGSHGVSLTDATAATTAAGNVVSGNTIAANGFALTGGGAGVAVSGGARHTIGGVGVGNVITSNANEGILVNRSGLTGSSVGVVIQGNYLGTNANSEISSLLGNRVGIRLQQANTATIDRRNVILNNSSDGISLEGTSLVTLGSTVANAGNIISQNGGAGVTITDRVLAGSVSNSGNNVFGNTITNNTGIGINVVGTTNAQGLSTTSNVVIGTSAVPGRVVGGQVNTIANNGGAGVTIDGAQGVTVEGNSVFGNVGLPIEIKNNGNLGAISPTLTSAVFTQNSKSTGQIAVQGTLAAPPTAGVGQVTVLNGVATFTSKQTLAANSLITIGGTNYTVAAAVTNGTQARLLGNPTVATRLAGAVSASRGAATFSVPQSPALVGQTIIVAGRTYTVTSLSANGRTGVITGAPTFGVSSFSQLQGNAFSFPSTASLNQQYVVDVYLNLPSDGNPTTGVGYGMRTFLGRATVTVGPTGSGAFSLTVNLPLGQVPVGSYLTATATTVRPAASVSAFSTSQVSSRARDVVFATPTTFSSTTRR